MFKKLMCWFLLPMVWVSLHGHSLEWSSFEWGKSKSEWSSSKDLRDRWVNSLLQECMRSKLEKEFIALGIQYELQSEDGWLPCHLSGSFLGDAKSKVETLEQAKLGNILDFSSELEISQASWRQWIQEQNKAEIPTEWSRDPPFESSFSYVQFLDRSERILQDICLVDLIIAFHAIETVEMGKSTLAREGLAAHSSYIPGKKGWEPSPGIARGGEPKSEEAMLFFNLPLSDEDKITIRQIVTTMADKNVIQLLLEKRSMEKKGDKIQPVHPLRFAGYVLTDPMLKRCMKAVSKSTFKWKGFIDGYEKRIKEERRAGTLDCYVPGLADLLEVDRSVVQRYINQENYGGLIKHFL